VQLPLFFPNKRPNLVDLDVFQVQVAKVQIEELAASVPEADHCPHDCVPVNACQPLSRADRVPLNQQPQNLDLLFPTDELATDSPFVSVTNPLEWVC